MVGNWLYGVAYRTALKARTLAAKRNRREKQVSAMPELAANAQSTWSDLQPLLDGELSRLPDKYRVPIVLCDLEGKGHKEAAEQLGWPQGTLSGRLSRARDLLAKRLQRHKLTVTAGSLTVLLANQVAMAQVPPLLAAETTRAAGLMVLGQTVTGVSPSVTLLTESVVKSMFLSKLTITGMACVALLAAGMTVGLLSVEVLAQRPERKADAAQGRGRPLEPAPGVHGGVVAVSGKTITLQVASVNRGEAPKKVDVLLDDKTAVVYNGVPTHGAKPTIGYAAQVWYQEGNTTTASKIVFNYADGTPRPDYMAKVGSVSADGKTIILEIPQGRQPNAEVKKIEIQLNEQTQLSYVYTAKDAEKPTAGYQAEVWIDRKERRATPLADRIRFTDMGIRSATTLRGKVLGVAADGKSFTIETTPASRNEAAKKAEIKLTASTDVTFHGVGPDEALLKEGQMASVVLLRESTDTAAKVMLGSAATTGRR
jgi:hypothetical protein